MFNRDRLPGLPGSSPRPAPRNDGYGQPPPQQPRQPPQPGYDSRMGGYDDRQQQGYGAPQQGYGAPQQRMPARGPPSGARQLRPIKSPGGNAYAFGNLYVCFSYPCDRY
jgi:vesicle-fusing ATPase